MKIMVIHGANLNMLGAREPSIYGNITIDSIDAELQKIASASEVYLESFQSNFEGVLVEKIQSLHDFDAIIINAGAYTHTSIAIRDALLAINKPFIEVHLSNIYAREEFRHRSYLSDIAVGVISGLGAESYYAAIRYFLAGNPRG
ncbi:MAG: type II 3-dehydroquinate dehydratase [Deferribacteraceae bacterium]|jgi:3-dehydroquinate dehydratase-2|nr:type II 3-dehydroquinate dehydratase [Deferribacteraceae bacterium]